MARQNVNNKDTGGDARAKINENFAELYTDKHTHGNAEVLNSLNEDAGWLTYKGEPIGAGMSASIYDTQRRAIDIFLYVDENVGALNAALAARLAGVL